MAANPADLVGTHIRTWRARRRLSQLDLALDAEISARHLSFIETGRSRPSRAMLIRLAERLRIPPRERNVLLVAGGFAPALPARTLDDPALAAARQAVDKVLAAFIAWLASRPAPPAPLVWLVIAGNVAWTAESFLLISTEAGKITAPGTAFVAAQAVAVLGLALLEYVGLRKMRAAV